MLTFSSPLRWLGSLVIRVWDSRLDGCEFDSRLPWLVLGWGDHLWVCKLPQYFTKPPRPTQPPTLSRTGNEYQPTCGDALQLSSKDRMGHPL